MTDSKKGLTNLDGGSKTTNHNPSIIEVLMESLVYNRKGWKEILIYIINHSRTCSAHIFCPVNLVSSYTIIILAYDFTLFPLAVWNSIIRWCMTEAVKSKRFFLSSLSDSIFYYIWTPFLPLGVFFFSFKTTINWL